MLKVKYIEIKIIFSIVFVILVQWNLSLQSCYRKAFLYKDHLCMYSSFPSTAANVFTFSLLAS